MSNQRSYPRRVRKAPTTTSIAILVRLSRHGESGATTAGLAKELDRSEGTVNQPLRVMRVSGHVRSQFEDGSWTTLGRHPKLYYFLTEKGEQYIRKVIEDGPGVIPEFL